MSDQVGGIARGARLSVAASTRGGYIDAMVKALPMQDYADTLEAQLLCDYVSSGMTMIDACGALGVPVSTTYDRIRASSRFAQMMDHAREAGFDVIANSCLAIADDTTQDAMIGQRGGTVMNAEFVARSKLRIWTRMQLLAKWHPKKYGEKLQVETKGASIAIPVGNDPVEAQKAYEQLMRG